MSRAMKDSGVPWIGSIPQNWETAPIKSAVAWKSVKGHGQATVLSLYRDYGVVPKDSRDDNHNVTSTETDAYKFVEKGDLVINKMKAWQGSMAISQFEGIVSPAYHVASLTNENVYAPYFNYLIRDVSYLPEYTRLSTGMRIGQWDLAFDDFIRIPFLLPPLDEQQRIADFLDIQTQEVDAAIVKTRESIEEYKKLKQAIITHAVTKGIRPNRAMKDSGVEQIRAMPEQWEVFRLKNAFSGHKSGSWGNDKNPHETGVVCYRIADFAYDKLRFNDETSRTIRYYQSREIEKLRLTKGDILIEKSGGGEKTPVGRAVLYDKDDGIALYANFMEKLTVADKVNPDWAVYYLSFLYSSKRVIPHIKQTTGLQNLDLRSFLSEEKMLLPPDCEQEEIVHYLDNKCGAIDALIDKKQQIITELESYKKSLIYEYVTGKKEVPA